MVITAPDAEILKACPATAARGDDSDRPDDDLPAGSAPIRPEGPNPPKSANSLKGLSINGLGSSPAMQVAWYGYRYFDPVTGRWPSRDPSGEKGGLNLYNFIDGSPINNIDDLGLRVRKISQDTESSYYSEDDDFYYVKLDADGSCSKSGKYMSCCTGKIDLSLTFIVSTKWNTEPLSQNIMVGLSGYDLVYEVVSPGGGGGVKPVGTRTGSYHYYGKVRYWISETTISLGSIKCNGRQQGLIHLGYQSSPSPTVMTTAFLIEWSFASSSCGKVTSSSATITNNSYYYGPERSKIKGVQPSIGENRLTVTH